MRAADPTDDDLTFLTQIGVEYVSLPATPQNANAESFTRMRERYEAAGVKVYNIGSGQLCSVQTVLDRLLAQARVRIEVRQSPELVRDTETRAARADAARLRRVTGWAPRFSLDQTFGATAFQSPTATGGWLGTALPTAVRVWSSAPALGGGATGNIVRK